MKRSKIGVIKKIINFAFKQLTFINLSYHGEIGSIFKRVVRILTR
jgi:hypothetical protein